MPACRRRLGPIRTHYDVLGVPADASPETIRAAYRRLAREHHPDVAGPASADTIHALNEAYRVLGDAGRRVVYDQALRPSGAPAPATTPAEPATPHVAVALPPARFPWRGLAVATVIAVIGVGAASLLSGPPAPAVPDGILQPGSCVTIEPNTDARETTCLGSGDVVVRLVVPVGVACPFGTAPHRDHQGQGTACLVFPD